MYQPCHIEKYPKKRELHVADIEISNKIIKTQVTLKTITWCLVQDIQYDPLI